MIKRIPSFLLSFSLSFCVSACLPTESVPALTLPAKTQEGRNTLGFLVNDMVWTIAGERCSWRGCEDNIAEATLWRSFDGNPYQLVVLGGYTSRSKEINETFQIALGEVKGPGTYNLDFKKGEIMQLFKTSLKEKAFGNAENYDAQLVITRLDTVQNVISGEFKGKLHNIFRPGETAEITEGRFDCQLKYIR